MRLPTFTRSAGTTTADDEITEVRPAVAPRDTKVDDRTPYAKSSTDTITRPSPPPPPVAVPVETGPRARTSIMATVGLALSVGAAALVMTGLLAGYGIGVAVIAFLASAAGFVATRHRHVAGKFDALVGMLVSAAALILGIMAVTGDLSWISVDSSTVGPAREWLDAQFPNWF
ncbi:hypothetical protein [Catenuloplanes japonicus]|uniref:hypothetical protein n=1 Tax=Catenuloplanes japonicus TaxID=33876 RepID=UPI00068D98FC|nr:hypothetical protein [Catenuloplanes japonicus]